MTVRAMNYADGFFYYFFSPSLCLNALSKYKQKEEKKKKRARENPNRFNFRYGEKAKWLQCKEGRLAGETLLQRETKLAAALRLLFIIYRVVLAWRAFPEGSQSQARGVGSLGHPKPHGGRRGDAGSRDRTGGPQAW